MGSFLFALIKFFGELAHRDQFLSGRLYMNSLDGFRQHEDIHKGDPMEGLLANLQPDRISVTLDGIEIDPGDFAGPLVVQPEKNDGVYVFCMYAVHSGGRKEIASRDLDVFLEGLQIDARASEIGPYCAIVTDVGRYFERVDSAFQSEGKRLHRRLVTYFDPTQYHGHVTGMDSAFMKRNSFEYQQEYRIAALEPNCPPGPLTIEVGDLTDICAVCSSKDLRDSFRLRVTHPAHKS